MLKYLYIERGLFLFWAEGHHEKRLEEMKLFAGSAQLPANFISKQELIGS